MPRTEPMDDLPKAYISRAALRHNFQLIKSITGNSPVCAMVKANAYGHDIAAVSGALANQGLSFWGVATCKEAVDLKDLGLREPILVLRPLGAYQPERALFDEIDLMVEAGMRMTVISAEGINLLVKRLGRKRKKARIHIKVDTGMGRNGCPMEKALPLVAQAMACPRLQVEGIYSHFATADERNLDFAVKQLKAFRSLLQSTVSRGWRIPLKHMANSGAIFNLPNSRLDMVRPGLALYGYGNKHVRGSTRLKPVLRLEAPLIMTKWIKKGGYSGYGCTFRAKRKTRIGLIPIGYADGYSRRWSNCGKMEYNGQLAPVIGRVSMDFTTIDITDMPGAHAGSPICIISNQRTKPHSVESMAEKLETIPYEITVLLGHRIQRVPAD